MILTAVIPIYGPTYAERKGQLETILKSTNNVSIVIVADSFLEHDKLSIQKLVQEYEDISIQIVFGEYGNPGSARNSGINLIQTNWFCFWDSDDEPFPDKYLELVNRAMASNCKIAKGGYKVVDSHGNRPERFVIPDVGQIKPAEHIVDPGLWRYVFETKCFGHLRFPPLRMGEDQDYLVKALLANEYVATLSDAVYSYRVGSSDQLTKNATSFNDVGESLSFLRDLVKRNALNDENMELILTSYLKQMISLIRYQKIGKKFRLIITESPFLLRHLFSGELFAPINLLLRGRIK